MSLRQWRLPHYIGPGSAKRYVLSGTTIKARDALAIGLVDYVLPLAQFDRRLEKIAQECVRLCAVGMIQSKLLMNEGFELVYDPFRGKYKDERPRMDALVFRYLSLVEV